MKILRNQSQRGGVLVVTILVCALVGIMLVAYLAMVSGQHTFTQRSQVWNNCIPMCESGVEEALAHINHINTTSNFAINGWVLQSGAFRKQRTNQGIATMAVDTNMPPTITVQGSLRSPISSGYLTRTVRVKTKMNQRFPNGILARGAIDLSGRPVDSFNSENPLESTFGRYDPLKATDHASIATVSKTPGQLVIGVTVNGYVGTGPGGTVTLSGSESIGSKLFNLNPLNDGKIEAGHSANDVNVYIPDATLPVPFAPAAPVAGIVGGTNYTYILGNGDYRLNTVVMNSGGILVNGKARLHVLGLTKINSSAYILLGNGASVEWYAGGEVDISGGGLINSPGSPKACSIIGLSNLPVSYSGHSQFYGTIYAPKSFVKLTGTADCFGAFVGSSFKISGGMGFHYDEALKGDPREGRFLAASWQEL